MSKCDDLLKTARNNPRGLRVEQAIALAECWGFVERMSKRGTSHRIFKRTGFINLLNFQPDKNGMAKAYQVRQLLAAIDLLLEKGEKARD